MGFVTRFWDFMTELFVIMNSFMIAEINKNKWIYQWFYDNQIIWKLSCVNLVRTILVELFELWTFWTMLIVYVPFSGSESFHMAHNQAKYFKKILFSNFWKTSNRYLCGRGPVKSVLFICPSACLSIHLWRVFFLWRILNFLDEDILPYIVKSDKPRFVKLYFLCR